MLLPEWELGGNSRPLRRYVWVNASRCAKRTPLNKVPIADSRNLRSCVQHDAAMLTVDLHNASVLMLGDSTSAQLLMHTCEAFTAPTKSFVPVNLSRSDRHVYSHRLRSLDNHLCELRAGSGTSGRVVLGSFSHFGVTGPPYWAYAYPMPPWLSNTSLGLVRNDIPRFKQHVPNGGDPTVVIANSGFWDISSWWYNLGNASKTWSLQDTPTANYTAEYLHGVHRFVQEVRRTFPRSLVVWRLMHFGKKHSITPAVVRHLNFAVRAAASSWRLPLLDVEPMIASLSKKANPGLGYGLVYGTLDGRHLHPWLNVALLNVILNLARVAHEAAGDN